MEKSDGADELRKELERLRAETDRMSALLAKEKSWEEMTEKERRDKQEWSALMNRQGPVWDEMLAERDKRAAEMDHAWKWLIAIVVITVLFTRCAMM